MIARHCNAAYPVIAAEKAGVWGIGCNSDMSADAPDAVLASVVFDWGVSYIRLVRSVIDGTFTTAPYLGGLAGGVVKLTPVNGKLAAPGTAEAVEAQRRRIVEGGFRVFTGVMGTSGGGSAGVPGASLSDGEIIGGMNWYYRTVIEEKSTTSS